MVPAWPCLVSAPRPCPRNRAPPGLLTALPTPTGLKLQGATCGNNKLSLSSAISTVLPLTQLRWVKQTNAERKANVVSTPPYSVIRQLRGRPLGTRAVSPPCPPQGDSHRSFLGWAPTPGAASPRTTSTPPSPR